MSGNGEGSPGGPAGRHVRTYSAKRAPKYFRPVHKKRDDHKSNAGCCEKDGVGSRKRELLEEAALLAGGGAAEGHGVEQGGVLQDDNFLTSTLHKDKKDEEVKRKSRDQLMRESKIAKKPLRRYRKAMEAYEETLAKTNRRRAKSRG